MVRMDANAPDMSKRGYARFTSRFEPLASSIFRFSRTTKPKHKNRLFLHGTADIKSDALACKLTGFCFIAAFHPLIHVADWGNLRIARNVNATQLAARPPAQSHFKGKRSSGALDNACFTENGSAD